MLIRTPIPLFIILATTATSVFAQTLPPLQTVRIPSTADAEQQPVRWWAPQPSAETPRPLLVSLHSWSGDYSQDRSAWLEQAVQREWIYIQPNFRGPNSRPEACGSTLAQQDILDAVDWALEKFKVDTTRIYLAGVSGGGHMTLQMAAHHSERFSAASAWAAPTDLFEWHRFHCRNGEPARYAQMMAASCGGAPGDSPEVDAQYRARSPVFHLAAARNLPLDVATGVKDGKTGSVPIHHTLRAYNAVAAANGDAAIPEAVMDELWREGRLSNPQESDAVVDPTYGREILLRRQSGKARVTIFEGGHEGLPEAGCAWLAAHSRPTASK